MSIIYAYNFYYIGPQNVNIISHIYMVPLYNKKSSASVALEGKSAGKTVQPGRKVRVSEAPKSK
ncbi:MAG TPA: hypothetical protein VEY51_16425 [Chondromyces sp.]|nr:hypothetical protein [Chondromyces sp.]